MAGFYYLNFYPTQTKLSYNIKINKIIVRIIGYYRDIKRSTIPNNKIKIILYLKFLYNNAILYYIFTLYYKISINLFYINILHQILFQDKFSINGQDYIKSSVLGRIKHRKKTRWI